MESSVKRQKSKSTTAALVAVWLVAVVAAINSALEIYIIISGRTLLAFNGADPRLPLSALPQVNQAELREGTSGYLVDAPFWLRLLSASPAVLYVVLALVAALLVARVVRGIADGHPFSLKVRTSLTALSVFLIGAGTIYGMLDAAAGRAIYEVASDFGAAPFPLGADYAVTSTNVPRWPYFMMTCGVVGLALAVAFKDGKRLEEEAEGLV